jgi:hypothetical protein
MASSIFGLGILVGISGVLRAYYVYKTYEAPEYDFTWVGYPYMLIGSIEIGSGLVCAIFFLSLALDLKRCCSYLTTLFGYGYLDCCICPCSTTFPYPYSTKRFPISLKYEVCYIHTTE